MKEPVPLTDAGSRRQSMVPKGAANSVREAIVLKLKPSTMSSMVRSGWCIFTMSVALQGRENML